MRICRFLPPGETAPRWGRVEEEGVREWRQEESLSQPATGSCWRIDELRWLPPVAGGRIFGIGRNYADHVAELSPGWTAADPLVFLKLDTALAGHGDPIVLPRGAGRVDYEGELALVIGRGGRHIPPERAAAHILGLTCANDVGSRDWQQGDGQWTRAKGCDSFCPLGPWVETAADPADLAIRTWLNGRLVQDSRSSLMLRPVSQLVAFLSSFCTLRPGDVILTGTPAGVGPLAPGDRVRVEIAGVGALENPVIAEGEDVRAL